MSIEDKATLKTHFETGDKPTEAQFANLIDSFASLDSEGNLSAVIIPRSGTAAELAAIVLEDGEWAFATDTLQFLLGDGSTAGGNPIAVNPFDQELNTDDSPIFTAIRMMVGGPNQENIGGMLGFDESTGTCLTAGFRDLDGGAGTAFTVNELGDANTSTLTVPGDTLVREIFSVQNWGDMGGHRVVINSDRFNINPKRTITNSDDDGIAGDWCYDDNYIYICLAGTSEGGDGVWKRAALSTW